MSDQTSARHGGAYRGQTIQVTLRVNGTTHTVDVPARRLLSDALRHDLRLTGTHVGCEHGVCGCCTVLLDGAPVRSCLMFTVSAEGHEITTVEGLSPGRRHAGAGADDDRDDQLHPIQRAFQECHGLQCGFCTPGFLMSVAGLLAGNPDPDRDEIVEGISGNLCRCTGYANIVAAVERAAELLRADEPVGADADAVPRADAGEVASHHPPPEAVATAPYAPAGDAVPGDHDDAGDTNRDEDEGDGS
ncbi:MAG TPA: (2Fe-2S)-binding protein [Euzebyales bacterium]